MCTWVNNGLFALLYALDMDSRNGSAGDVLVAEGAAPGCVCVGQFDGLPFFDAGAGAALPTGFADVGATLVPLVVGLGAAALEDEAAADWERGVDGFLTHDRRTRRPVVVVVVVVVFVLALVPISVAERSLFRRLWWCLRAMPW